MFKSRDANALAALDAALAKEIDGRVRKAMLEARAAIVLLQPSASEADKVAAVAVIREHIEGTEHILAGLLPRSR